MSDPTVDVGGKNAEGPGGGRVGTVGIAVIAAYLLVLSAALLYCLMMLWNSPEPASPAQTKAILHEVAGTSQGAGTPDPIPVAVVKGNGLTDASLDLQQLDTSEVSFVGWKFKVRQETRLLLLVVCAGALGSLVHGLRSIYWYIGNRNLVWSWVPKYLIQPFGASVLAVVFYLVIRGGFFSADAGSQHTSPFGFMALSAMVGMFSEQAVLKLKDIAETLLTKPPPGRDAEPDKRQS